MKERHVMGNKGRTAWKRCNYITTTIFPQEIWRAQPIVASLIFGLPALLFSFLIYTLCIADPGEGYDEEFDENEDEDYREDEEGPGVDATSQEKPKTE